MYWNILPPENIFCHLSHILVWEYWIIFRYKLSKFFWSRYLNKFSKKTWYNSKYDPGDKRCSQWEKCFNTPNLYTTNVHFYNSSINIGFIFFSHLLTCTNPIIYLDAKSGSCSSNLSSKLILSRSILRIPIPLQLKTTSSEPSLRRVYFHLRTKQ